MSTSLHTEVAHFKAWAATQPVESLTGEWECDYANWPQLKQALFSLLDSGSPANASAAVIPDILYAVARDYEMEELAEALSKRLAWFLFLLPHALASSEADVRWQFAVQLGNRCVPFANAEQALLTLIEDSDEYTSRRALQALGQIGSGHTEMLCERAWATGHEYQRIMVLRVLQEIKSPNLPEYLTLAREDGRAYILSNAVEIDSTEDL